jgi:uncharacterized DUF497 family protein
MRLEWDSAKNESNRATHDLSFDEAAEISQTGLDSLETHDESHSGEEDRFLAVGRIGRGVIVVVDTERDDDVLRIVSARMAKANERRRYEEHEEAKRRG